MFCSKCGSKINEGDLFCIKCGNKAESNNAINKKNTYRDLIIGIIGITVFAIIVIMCFVLTNNSKNDINENNLNGYISQVNIDEETKSNITKLYSRVSGYNSSNIIKAMYWKLVDGTPTLLIAYKDTNRNGMYIQVEGSKVYKNYGDEESLYSGSGKTMRESKELIFSIYQDSEEHIFLTGDEFREIIK